MQLEGIMVNEQLLEDLEGIWAVAPTSDAEAGGAQLGVFGREEGDTGEVS
jgi:hypothetical protein